MLNVFKRFYHRHFTNPEAVILVLFLVTGLLLFLAFGETLASVIAALIIAFLLDGIIHRLQIWHVSRGTAVSIVYTGFLGLLALCFFVLIPLLWQQIFHLLEEMPSILGHWREQLLLLPVHYPELVSVQQVNDIINAAGTRVSQFGEHILSLSSAVVPIIAAIVVYFILVPLMVFFMLKDREKIFNWFSQFMPEETGLVKRVWDEVHIQLGNYVRGKVCEILIIGISCWIFFVFMGLPYAALMGVIVGLSVVIPYVGAAVASIPLILIAFFQWGFSPHFLYFLIGYAVILGLDGNVLIPLLFAEVVDIHPLAIVIAIIFFGGIWGFWGVFFAIPLGILIKAVINAWPEPQEVPQHY
ncbi:MAG: AI-2E family transporter [Gammaproteobacteria bacterium]